MFRTVWNAIESLAKSGEKALAKDAYHLINECMGKQMETHAEDNGYAGGLRSAEEAAWRAAYE